MQPIDPEPSSIPGWIHWLGWAAVLALVTVGMLSAHQRLDQVHVVLVYLLVVLGGSATSGRPLGVLLACAGFVLIDYFFQPPFSSIGVGKPLPEAAGREMKAGGKDFLLSPMRKQEMAALDEVLDRVRAAVEAIFTRGPGPAMSEFNRSSC